MAWPGRIDYLISFQKRWRRRRSILLSTHDGFFILQLNVCGGMLTIANTQIGRTAPTSTPPPVVRATHFKYEHSDWQFCSLSYLTHSNSATNSYCETNDTTDNTLKVSSHFITTLLIWLIPWDCFAGFLICKQLVWLDVESLELHFQVWM